MMCCLLFHFFRVSSLNYFSFLLFFFLRIFRWCFIPISRVLGLGIPSSPYNLSIRSPWWITNQFKPLSSRLLSRYTFKPSIEPLIWLRIFVFNPTEWITVGMVAIKDTLRRLLSSSFYFILSLPLVSYFLTHAYSS